MKKQKYRAQETCYEKQTTNRKANKTNYYTGLQQRQKWSHGQVSRNDTYNGPSKAKLLEFRHYSSKLP